MDGGQDLGGLQGLGPVNPEADEPVFHADWERRVLALTLATGARGEWNIDASRHARENRDPVDYLSSSYYELWLKGLEALLAERGLVSEAEIEARLSQPKGVPIEGSPRQTGTLMADQVEATLRRGGPASVDADIPPRFKAGDRVMTRKMHPAGHTRLPRYARGREGVIARDNGVFIFPDSNAHGRGPDPRRLYSVRFAARDLWGEDAPAAGSVFLDLFEPYLLAAGQGTSEESVP